MSIFFHYYNAKLPKFNISKAIENAYTIQVRQQYVKHDYTKFQTEIQIAFRYVFHYP